MLFNYVTSQLLLVLFTIFVVVLAGPCMPCQPSNRRDTPWDHGLLSRGVYSPKITNPTKGSIWNVASDNVVTWYTLFRRKMSFKSLITLRLSIIRDLQDKSDKTSKSKGTLLLGYFEGGSDEEHLYFGACQLLFASIIIS